MTTRNDDAMTTNNTTLVTRATMNAIAGYSKWQGDYNAAEALEYKKARAGITWQGGTQQGRTIYNVGKKEVRPGLWELYCSSSEYHTYTLYKYEGVYADEEVVEFINGWHLKYSR